MEKSNAPKFNLSTDIIKTIITPLVKKLCENAAKSEDNVICIIAQEFGKLVLGLESKKPFILVYNNNNLVKPK